MREGGSTAIKRILLTTLLGATSGESGILRGDSWRRKWEVHKKKDKGLSIMSMAVAQRGTKKKGISCGLERKGGKRGSGLNDIDGEAIFVEEWGA